MRTKVVEHDDLVVHKKKQVGLLIPFYYLVVTVMTFSGMCVESTLIWSQKRIELSVTCYEWI